MEMRAEQAFQHRHLLGFSVIVERLGFAWHGLRCWKALCYHQIAVLMILLIAISDVRANLEDSFQAGLARVQVSPKECSAATVLEKPVENLLSYRRMQWPLRRRWRMEVEEVDRLSSTIFQLHVHVLTHPILMLPTEWTFQ